MDVLKALPPPPPSHNINSRTINSNTGSTDNFLRNILVNSIKGERNDIVAPITNTVKDVYDYVFIDSGSPDSYLNADITTFTNDSIVFYNSTLFNNSSTESITNGTNLNGDEDVGELIIMAVISIILGLMILITVIGNVFVIAAIILERNLQNVANYLVASLAVADLFVACLVMPLGAVYEISRGWILGPELCDIWTSCDVLCCTASILHLVAIATDRYWAVTNVDYMHSRTSRRVFMMIFLVWFAAVIVSLAPQFGWKDPEYLQRIEQQKCMVSQDISYQVFATCCTFYVPLLVILVLYWKIYQTARKRIHRRRPKPVLRSNNNNQTAIQPKIKTRLRFRIASKFTTQGRSAVSSLGLVEGNSTNTVNTVEDTEDSSNEHKSKIVNSSGNGGGSGVQPHINNGTGIEITTAFNNGEEIRPTTKELTLKEIPTNDDVVAKEPEIQEQINTVSHQVDNKQILETNCDLINSNNNNQTINTNQLNLIVQSQNVQQNNQNLNNQIIISQVSTPVQQSHHSHQQTANQNVSSISNPQSQVTKRKETLEAKRERKAAKTLAIITGAFVICWLPFFLMALLLPLCESCSINDSIASLFLWLGYFNSTLNPVIYTIFSPEFRQAFKRILFGAHRSSSYYRGSRF